MLVKMGWSTFPSAVRALAEGRTVLGVAPFVPFQFQPDALFWLVPSRAAREQPEFLKPAYRDLYRVEEAANGPTVVRFLGQVLAVVAQLPRGGPHNAAIAEALGDDLIWTPEWLLAQAEASGRDLYVFALGVYRAERAHTLERTITSSGQLGLRALEIGTPQPLLPLRDVRAHAQAIMARVQAAGGAPAGTRPVPSTLAPRPAPASPAPALSRPAARPSGAGTPEVEQLRAETLRLRHERDQLTAQVEDLKKLVAVLQERIAELEEENAQMQAEKAELEQALEELHVEAEERDAQLAEMLTRVQQLEQRPGRRAPSAPA